MTETAAVATMSLSVSQAGLDLLSLASADAPPSCPVTLVVHSEQLAATRSAALAAVLPRLRPARARSAAIGVATGAGFVAALLLADQVGDVVAGLAAGVLMFFLLGWACFLNILPGFPEWAPLVRAQALPETEEIVFNNESTTAARLAVLAQQETKRIASSPTSASGQLADLDVDVDVKRELSDIVRRCHELDLQRQSLDAVLAAAAATGHEPQQAAVELAAGLAGVEASLTSRVATLRSYRLHLDRLDLQVRALEAGEELYVNQENLRELLLGVADDEVAAGTVTGRSERVGELLSGVAASVDELRLDVATIAAHR